MSGFSRAALLALFITSAALGGPPRVLRMSPDHGDAGVDPALKELRVEFDQDMSPGGRSICGGGPQFPRMDGAPRWETPRVLIVPITLEPAHTYSLSINCPAARNFRGANGDSAEIAPLSFKTAKAGEAPAPAAALTPELNANAIAALRSAINDRYSYRDRVVKDWDALIAGCNEPLLNATTRAEFARVLGRALAAAQDLHMTVRVGDAYFPTASGEMRPNFEARRLTGAIKNFKQRSPIVGSGLAADGVGYIMIGAWPGTGDQLHAAHEALDEMIDLPTLIVDVRPNGGGDELAAKLFAARFARERTVYSLNRTRDPKQPGGWTGVMSRSVGPDDAKGAKPYTGKVAVLTGPVCMSSNESFILMMRHGGNATLVGERTRGSSGNPRSHDLGNGVLVVLPSWEDHLPDGTALEGVGIVPDVQAPLGADGDGVIAKAVETLKAGR